MPIEVESPLVAFDDNDRDYLFWTSQHPRGYVVKCYRESSADYLMLHWADCRTIKGNLSPWTTGDYAKVCSPTVADLEAWTSDLGGSLTKCSVCWA